MAHTNRDNCAEMINGFLSARQASGVAKNGYAWENRNYFAPFRTLSAALMHMLMSIASIISVMEMLFFGAVKLSIRRGISKII